MNWLTWALLSAAFAGLTAVLAKVRDVDPNLATAIRTAVVLVISWAIAVARGTYSVAGLPHRTWMFLVLSGLATGASWLCYLHALRFGEASKVAPIDKLSVVFVIVLAAAVLGEPLSWDRLIGGSLIVAGVIILARA